MPLKIARSFSISLLPHRLPPRPRPRRRRAIRFAIARLPGFVGATRSIASAGRDEAAFETLSYAPEDAPPLARELPRGASSADGAISQPGRRVTDFIMLESGVIRP